MPAALTEARKKEIARVVASSPTMAGAAVALGYKNKNSLAVTIACNLSLREEVRKARVRAGRPTFEKRPYRLDGRSASL